MKTQTDSNKYEGQCKFCKNDFTKRQIITHLDICSEREKNENVKNIRLRIVDAYIKNFWLIVEINEQAKFKDLDNLIKNVWVECCGHLSSFGGYENQIDKGRIIADTLNLGDKIDYIYDFGSSTELSVEVLKYSTYQLSNKKNAELVARNYVPPSNCLKCNQQSEWVCAPCGEEAMAFACDACAKKYHNEENEKEEHYLLSLANSPRCGVCGYESKEFLDKLF